MRIISTMTHGVLDYVVAFALILAPTLFGFAEYAGPAAMLARTVGAVVLVMALMTRYELGVFHVIPMPVHLAADFAAGLLLLASPWLFGFSGLPANAWVPHVVVGLLVAGAAVMTETQPRTVAA